MHASLGHHSGARVVLDACPLPTHAPPFALPENGSFLADSSRVPAAPGFQDVGERRNKFPPVPIVPPASAPPKVPQRARGRRNPRPARSRPCSPHGGPGSRDGGTVEQVSPFHPFHLFHSQGCGSTCAPRPGPGPPVTRPRTAGPAPRRAGQSRSGRSPARVGAARRKPAHPALISSAPCERSPRMHRPEKQNRHRPPRTQPGEPDAREGDGGDPRRPWPAAVHARDGDENGSRDSVFPPHGRLVQDAGKGENFQPVDRSCRFGRGSLR